ncbi:GNAT family N-acetyltransferase [Hyphobacterium marinum]|uniref:GNAT family N-acetyltransferase n=1 Tax=Hyphobacterium marinum TaxID=3116574 RepID=A0ABU7LUK1_9PROT|nr:GNAT family N-acetyltransferase [Hyphobacterium sp. Y6023]MEE2565229.1 GNAT family N-acetyltransferase [Hyphobacterium sp. Y6023]
MKQFSAPVSRLFAECGRVMVARSPEAEPDLTLALATASPDDLDVIDAIETAAFDRDRFPRRNLSRMLTGGRTRFLLARLGDAPAAYAAISLKRGSRVARLYSLAVTPEARGKGVAAALLEGAQHLGAEAGCTVLRLEVRASNTAARGLYERENFRLRGRRNAYYEDGEAALLYERAISGTVKESAP